MNQLKSILFVSLRNYSNKTVRRRKLSKHKEKKANVVSEEDLYPEGQEFDFSQMEDGDEVDPDHLEADFSSVGKLYAEHNREMMVAKEKLKLRIVARKYFKSEDPNFVTWSERVQIQALHNQDSEEWSPERLSEAFPALPETIKKILRSKYLPKTTKDVIKYDLKVAETWEAFKKGSLALDPRLEAHLNNFKGRELKITHLASEAEKFVRPKPVFPVPTSNFFTRIVTDYVEANEPTKESQPQKLPHKKINKNNNSKELVPIISIEENKVSSKSKHVTFDAFLEKKVNELGGQENLCLEDSLLVDEYKTLIDKRNLENSVSTSDRAISTQNVEQSSSIATSESASVKQVKVPEIDFTKNNLVTGILEWKKKESVDDEDYPKFIKIPREKAKSGVTFKVKDRYYDADGEFLYRVPGLKT